MGKLIPSSLNYFITEDGVVTDENGRVKNTYVNGDGYITVCIKLVSGKFQTFDLHRLKMLTFKPIDNPEEYVVNHRDLDKTNNDLSNLEWISNRLNILHSSILVNMFNKRPLIKLIYEDGKSEYHDDLTSVAKYLNEPIESCWDAVKDGTNLNGKYLTHVRYNDPKACQMKLSKQGLPKVNIRPCKTYDLITGK